MKTLRQLRLKTMCESCIHKCCIQPYDWVFLTTEEVLRLETASGLSEEEFLVERRNTNNGHVFRTLNLPCRFLEPQTGRCNVYQFRPLVCRLFPFYPEPLTGHATLLPVQCGDNLQFVASDSKDGWSLTDFEEDVRQWLAQLWQEAEDQSWDATSTAHAAGSP
jgi:Fe-S-cluster containining protein